MDRFGVALATFRPSGEQTIGEGEIGYSTNIQDEITVKPLTQGAPNPNA